MKNRILFFFLLFFSFSVSFAINRALLIGISEYKDSSWKQLSSKNDITILKQRISKDFEIVELIDGDATYQNIKTQLSILCEKSMPGDTVFIHFSGHGQQMVAIGKEEIDGLDEALVPYDAYLKYEKGKYEGECHFRDNEFSMCVNTIRKKLDGNGLIIVTLDTCHSGNFERNEKDEKDAVVRGVDDIFGREALSRQEQMTLDMQHLKTDHTSISPEGCNVIFISACKPYETNFEIQDFLGNGYGPLSYSFALAYQKYGLKDTNSLYVEIAKQMSQKARKSQHAVFNSSFGFVAPTLK